MASSAKEARQIAEAVYTQLRTGTPDSIAHNSTAISTALAGNEAQRGGAVPLESVFEVVASTHINGPGKRKLFHWNGVSVKLQPRQWKLVAYLWRCKDRMAKVDAVQDNVWQHDAQDSTIRRAASAASSCFAVKNVPIYLSVTDGKVTLHLPS